MTDLEPIVDKVLDRTELLLQKLSASLGTTVEHLWEILIKQVYVDAIGCCLVIGIALVFGIAWTFYSKFWYKKIKEDNWHKDGFTTNIVISIIVYLVLFIILGDNLYSIFSCLYNPEYQALQEILKYIK